MHKEFDARHGAGRRAATLLVLLPGAYGTPADFRRAGFVERVRARGLDADLLMAEAHVGYYGEGRIVPALRTHIVDPVRSAGYRAIWFVGISLGALGALGYAREHGGDVAGVYAIAPYPGARDVMLEVERAGGLAPWARTLPAADDDVRLIWHWLARGADAVHGSASGARSIPIHVGLASDDRFVAGQRLMFSALPAGRVRELSGNHDWQAWGRLWDDFLGRNILCAT